MKTPERTTAVVIGSLLLVLVLAGVWAYASDVGIEATVTDKGTDSEGRYVVARTDIGGLEVKRYLPLHEWLVIQEGNHVVYHVNSGVTEIYTRQGGTLIWRG